MVLEQELATRRQKNLANPPDPADWLEAHFYIPELNAPITLAEYQRVALREALSRDERGLYKYSTIVWSDIKKSAKTTIAAGVAMWTAFSRRYAKIRLVGNDLRQADSRVFNALSDAIKLNSEWQGVRVIRHRVELENGSVIEAVPIDPSGEAGGNDDMVEWTELWAATSDAHEKMWAELTLSPTKFGRSFRWVDTYAGYSGKSKLLEGLYQLAVKDQEPLDLGLPGLECYAKGRLFVLWNTKPQLSWQTDEYYQQQAVDLTDSEFSRMHRNQWVSPTQTYVPREWWDACKVEKLPEDDGRWVIALDAGVSDDCFAMVGVTRRKGKTEVRYARKWSAPPKGKLDYAPIDTELRRLLAEHPVLEVTYDPYQLHDFCTRLRNSIRTCFVREFSQGADRIIADKDLYDAIRDRNIQHRGEPDLAEHIQNADAKAEGDSKLRIVKRSQTLKVDLAVALSMASARATKLLR